MSLIMVIRSDEMAYRFNSLPIKHKMGFYWKNLGLDNIVYIPEWQDSKVRYKFEFDFCKIVNDAAEENLGFRSINWMKALLHKDGYSDRRVE